MAFTYFVAHTSPSQPLCATRNVKEKAAVAEAPDDKKL